MKNKFHKIFLVWIPFAAVITFACGLSYVLVQQDMRQNANDPQIEVSRDIMQDMAEGATPQDIVPPGQTIDLSSSLDPFVIIYSATGTVLGSSGVLNGQTPALPSGVLTSVTQNGEDRFTWQPAQGVRIAAVVDTLPAPVGGFILVGRSISIIEGRESNILHIVELAWLAGLIVMFIIIWAMVAWYEKHKANHQV